MPEKKKKSIDIVLHYILENKLPPGKVLNGGIVGKLSEQLISIGDHGFDVFTMDGKNVKSVDSYLWSDFSHSVIDKMALSVRFSLTGNRSVQISVPELNEFLPYLQSNGIKTEYVKRKWYRKIIGFRSGKRWKMVMASIGYLLIILLIIGLAVPNGDQPKAQADKPKTAATLPAKQTPKKQSTEDRIKAAIQTNNAFGTTNSFNNKSSLISLNYNKDNGFVFARVYGQDNLSNNSIKKGMWMSTTAALKHLKPVKEVKEVYLNIVFPMQDAYGKKTDSTVMKVDFKRKTIDKIDFSNFQSDNVPVVSDQYWQHPSFNN
ncbi:hypothetical protein OYT88_06380 [Sporolactobacillus sp. CQH2019]|uniref:hypothetical protein n=1 Tax=Sporolactobacillus sp. CQH2019 TaxID=3023512 RepID=UPI002367593B|nr:hypothetical protein [Sporolactobacillus sp. CQH2019]MDD9148173.1 hypothetical protein [Sporolactobacillus sp. CQH2019]